MTDDYTHSASLAARDAYFDSVGVSYRSSPAPPHDYHHPAFLEAPPHFPLPAPPSGSFGLHRPHPASIPELDLNASRSRPASIASFDSASSLHSNSSSYVRPHSNPTLPTTLHDVAGVCPRLLPGLDELGFVVELPVGGNWEVSWSELVGLLLNPASTACLNDEHLVKQAAHFMQAKVYSIPQPTTTRAQISPPHSPPLDRNASWPVGVVHHKDFGTNSARHHGVPLDLPKQPSVFGSFDPDNSLHLSRVDSASAFLTPLQKAFLPQATGASSTPPLEDLVQSSSLSTHSRSSITSSEQQRLDSERERRARRLTQPYQRPKSHHSTASSSISSNELENNVKKAPRPLNSQIERFMWNANQAQLYRLGAGSTHDEASGDPLGEHAEVLVFPVGSYYKVVKDDLEILPSDVKGLNDWLRGQSCVTDCRFHFENKRPSVIRNHLIGCKLRSKLTSDPLKRLCELQVFAQKRFRVSSSQPRPGSSAGWSDHSSISDSYSFENDADDIGSFAYGHPDDLKRHSVFESLPVSTPPMDPILAAEHEDTLSDLVTPFSSAQYTKDVIPEWETEPWLAGYGLRPPTGERSLPDEPNQLTSSFLSMDEMDEDE